MLRYPALTLVAAIAALSFVTAPVTAGARKPVRSEAQPADNVEHRASRAYRRAPQVRSYVTRRGGYSFGVADTINTYGDGRSIYGGASSYRSYQFDRQTNAGPFDHGFFFDSGISPRGGDSPYQN